MIRIQHRCNTIAELQATPHHLGVEIDLRNHGGDLLLVHDPFDTTGVPLGEWLTHYRHRFLIANVKEEGLEPVLLPLLAQHGVQDFFILDESLPYIRRHALAGVPQFALRVSEFESAETALRLAAHLAAQNARVDWLWLDSFTGAPRPPAELAGLRAAGFRLCQVSPELHHVAAPERWESLIADFQARMPDWPSLDMVCTKRPDLWERT